MEIRKLIVVLPYSILRFAFSYSDFWNYIVYKKNANFQTERLVSLILPIVEMSSVEEYNTTGAEGRQRGILICLKNAVSFSSSAGNGRLNIFRRQWCSRLFLTETDVWPKLQRSLRGGRLMTRWNWRRNLRARTRFVIRSLFLVEKIKFSTP